MTPEREVIRLTPLPDPQWPVLLLALIQAGDAVLCLRPAAFIADCFAGVNWPRRFW